MRATCRERVCVKASLPAAQQPLKVALATPSSTRVRELQIVVCIATENVQMFWGSFTTNNVANVVQIRRFFFFFLNLKNEERESEKERERETERERRVLISVGFERDSD